MPCSQWGGQPLRFNSLDTEPRGGGQVIDGAIAASAPIWQLADTVRRPTLDMQVQRTVGGGMPRANGALTPCPCCPLQAVAITRGVSAVGGATDQCRDNLRAAWPLLQQVGTTHRLIQAPAWHHCGPAVGPHPRSCRQTLLLPMMGPASEELVSP